MIIAMEHASHQPNALIRAEELQEIVLLGNTFKIFYDNFSLKLSMRMCEPAPKHNTFSTLCLECKSLLQIWSMLLFL